MALPLELDTVVKYCVHFSATFLTPENQFFDSLLHVSSHFIVDFFFFFVFFFLISILSSLSNASLNPQQSPGTLSHIFHALPTSNFHCLSGFLLSYEMLAENVNSLLGVKKLWKSWITIQRFLLQILCWKWTHNFSNTLVYVIEKCGARNVQAFWVSRNRG